MNHVAKHTSAKCKKSSSIKIVWAYHFIACWQIMKLLKSFGLKIKNKNKMERSTGQKKAK